MNKDKPKLPDWNHEEIQILITHYPTMETCDVAILVGRSEGTVGRKASKLGIKKDKAWHSESRSRKAKAAYEAGNKQFLLAANAKGRERAKQQSKARTGHGEYSVREVPGGRIVTHYLRG